MRQAESLDLLIALNSGLPGMCTIHANSAREAVTKMCTLPLLAGENVGSRFVVPTVAGCVDLVVHVALDADGVRRVREVVAVPGRVEQDVVETADIFTTRGGRLVRADGFPPHQDRFERAGIDLAAILRHETSESWVLSSGCCSGPGSSGLVVPWTPQPRGAGQPGHAPAGERGSTTSCGRPAWPASARGPSALTCAGVALVTLWPSSPSRRRRRSRCASRRWRPGRRSRWCASGRGADARCLRDVWPEAVDNLTSAVRAGLSLPEALAQLGDRGPIELRPAFRTFAEDYRATGRFVDCLDRLKDRLADPVADRIVEALRLAREVGGSDLGRLLRTLSTFLREDARTRGELETRQCWTVNAARLAVAAPWIVLALLATRPEAVAAYDRRSGALVLGLGGLVSVVAYRVMVRVGRLPEEKRVLR